MKTNAVDVIDAYLRDLVDIRSTASEPSELDKSVAYVHEQLSSLAWLTVNQERLAGKPLVWGYSRKPSSKTVWIAVHLDVVPAGEGAFQLTKDADKYYGRGVLDMKGVAAATLAAAKIMQSPKASIAFVFTTDEESGGASMKAFVDRYVPSGSAALVFDGGEHWTLEEQAKGILHLRVSASGTAAHGARPWLGSNAIEQLIECNQTFQAWFLDHINLPSSKRYEDTTYNLGTISGGTATNQVPASASLTLDIRYTNTKHRGMILAWFKQYHQLQPAITADVVVEGASTKADTSLRQVLRFQKLMNKYGLAASNTERLAYGGTDGRFFAAKGIPVIVTRPPGGQQHQDGEWVSAKGLAQLSQLVNDYISEVAS